MSEKFVLLTAEEMEGRPPDQYDEMTAAVMSGEADAEVSQEQWTTYKYNGHPILSACDDGRTLIEHSACNAGLTYLNVAFLLRHLVVSRVLDDKATVEEACRDLDRLIEGEAVKASKAYESRKGKTDRRAM
jgi:hypothetical protein